MKRIVVVLAAVAVLGSAVLFVAAPLVWSQTAPAPAPATQPETQRPSQPQRERGDGRPSFRGPGERRFDARAPGDGMGPPRTEWRRGDVRPEYSFEPTPEEWKEIETFMKAHSPKRFERLEELGDDQRQQGVRNMFAGRYRALLELKDKNPELYQIRLARMPIEDKVFDLGWRLKQKQGEKPEEIKAQLRAPLRQLIKSRMHEQALRLRDLEKQVEQARQRLKDEEQRLEDLVDQNLTDLSDDRLPRDLRPQLPPRRERRSSDDESNSDGGVNASQTGD